MTSLTASALLTDALRLSRAGYRVFPVYGDGRPMFRNYHGVHAFPERELERANWDQAAFVGLALPPEVIVLDVDHKDGRKRGWDHLRWLEGTFGSLPRTPSQSTMSAGIHLLFRLPKGMSEKSLAPEVTLPDGQPSHIDILRHSHRYARVHSLEMWLNVEWSDVPPVPNIWFQALTRPKRDSQARSDASGQPCPTLTLQEALGGIAHASEGSRNSTLSAKAFGLFLRGYNSESDLEALRDAAARSGLARHEIDRVLDSAIETAWRRYLPIAEWVSKVQAAAVAQRPRSEKQLVTLAVLMAEKALSFPEDRWIALSSRDAAELVGVGVGTAHSYLSWMASEGLIRKMSADQRGLAASYRIVSKPNTCPPPYKRQVFGSAQLFGAIHLRRHYRIDLAVAPAFQRMRGELSHKPTLRPTAQKVLIALESGPLSVKALIDKAGVSASSVRRAVKELESCALVSREGRQVIPQYIGDCEASVREWIQFHDLESRNEARRKRHERERFQYGEYLLLRDGVPIKGLAKGRLRLLLGSPEASNRIRHDLRVHIERQRGRPILAVLQCI